MQVEVSALGTKRPARLQVRFTEDELEGREEWVPPKRLKVPWSGVEQWLDLERKWSAVAAASPGSSFPDCWAAGWALDAVGEDVIEVGSEGESRVLAVPRLLELLESDDSILKDDLAFVDADGSLIVPWAVTRRLAVRAAPRVSEQLFAMLDKDEQEALHDATFGRSHGGHRGGDEWFTSPEVCARIDDELWKPARAVLRHWVGEDASGRHDELVALRAELRRLGQLLEQAALALHDGGLGEQARVIEDELGVPVDVLRRRGR